MVVSLDEDTSSFCTVFDALDAGQDLFASYTMHFRERTLRMLGWTGNGLFHHTFDKVFR